MISEQLIEEILAQKSAPGHITKPEELNAEKRQQRAEAARYLAKHTTILELYAGEGNLSEKVYARLNPQRMVLVDDDERALQKAKQRLAPFGIAKFFYPMSADRFIEKGFLRRYPDITLVDFDAHQTPHRTIQLFLDHYPIRGPMIVAFTDRLMQQEAFGLEDMAMKNFGARRSFRAWRINRAFGGPNGRVYAGYLLRPVQR